MSSWTDFRDSVVNTVVPDSVRNATASDAGAIAGATLVKIASEPPKGNQTAAQIAAGDFGALSHGVSGAVSSAAGKLKISVPLLIAGAGAIYLLMKKRGRK